MKARNVEFRMSNLECESCGKKGAIGLDCGRNHGFGSPQAALLCDFRHSTFLMLRIWEGLFSKQSLMHPGRTLRRMKSIGTCRNRLRKWVAAARRDPEHRRQLGLRPRSADSAMGESLGAVGPPAPTAIPHSAYFRKRVSLYPAGGTGDYEGERLLRQADLDGKRADQFPVRLHAHVRRSLDPERARPEAPDPGIVRGLAPQG